MQLPVTSRPWKDKPPAERWTVIGIFLGFFGGLVAAVFAVDDRTMAIVVVVVAAVLGAVALRIAYELFRRMGRSA
jgi:membrane protein DedA with SNARE-associated domain